MPVITGVWPPKIPRMMRCTTAPNRLSGNGRDEWQNMHSNGFVQIRNRQRGEGGFSVIFILALLLWCGVFANLLYHIGAELFSYHYLWVITTCGTSAAGSRHRYALTRVFTRVLEPLFIGNGRSQVSHRFVLVGMLFDFWVCVI